MKLLAIETATDACSCALELDGEQDACFELAPRRHAELVLGMVDQLLERADVGLTNLDGLVFGRGPGSFTGVRIAASVVQGLAFGAELEVVGVSSLHALAEGVRRERGEARVLAAFDARMSEVYWGAYVVDEGVMTPILEEGVFAPGAVPLPDSQQDWFGAGDGWKAYEPVLRERVGRRVNATCGALYPHAIDVVSLGLLGFERGEAVSPQAALPVYLRNTVTRDPK